MPSKIFIINSSLIVFILIWHISSSLWLLWGLLPATYDLNWAVDGLQRFPWLQTAVPLSLEQVNAVAVSYQGTQQVVVIKPWLKFQFQAKRDLMAAGYQVERLGFILRASKGVEQPLSKLPHFDRSWPTHPVFIATGRPSSIPALTDSFTALGVRTPHGLKMAIAWHDQPLDRRLLNIISPAQPSGVTSIDVPARTIDVLPQSLAAQLTRQITTQLGFTKTRPAILTASPDTRILISLSAAGAAVGQQGNVDEFLQRATTWLQSEDANLHLRKRAFNTPDRTLGYEWIPGKIRPVFTFSPNSDGCYEPLIDRLQLWLCRKLEMAVLASSPAAARESLNTAGQSYYVAGNLPVVEKLGIPGLVAISLDGQNDYAVINASITPNRHWSGH